jgi:hypothetical protein
MFIKRFLLVRNLGLAIIACAALASYACAADEDHQPDPCGQILSTNQRITPTAAPDGGAERTKT